MPTVYILNKSYKTTKNCNAVNCGWLHLAYW